MNQKKLRKGEYQFEIVILQMVSDTEKNQKCHNTELALLDGTVFFKYSSILTLIVC